MSSPIRTPQIAFFDVDGTLTTEATIFSFLRFHLATTGRSVEAYAAERRRLRELVATTGSREIANRAYFRTYAEVEVAVAHRQGEEWFEGELRRGGFLHEDVVAAARALRRAGAAIVLVSGSFPPCLEPLARLLDADEIRCSRPAETAGRYTGDLEGEPMIGDAKARAVELVTRRRGVDPADCVAYGDHSSDLPMLDAVGSAVVVGDDPVLIARATARSWDVLPGQGSAALS